MQLKRASLGLHVGVQGALATSARARQTPHGGWHGGMGQVHCCVKRSDPKEHLVGAGLFWLRSVDDHLIVCHGVEQLGLDAFRSRGRPLEA